MLAELLVVDEDAARVPAGFIVNRFVIVIEGFFDVVDVPVVVDCTEMIPVFEMLGLAEAVAEPVVVIAFNTDELLVEIDCVEVPPMVGLLVIEPVVVGPAAVEVSFASAAVVVVLIDAGVLVEVDCVALPRIVEVLAIEAVVV